MKILNLYAGIGGNRKLWSDEHQITAVEFEPKIAAIYKDLYPNDNIFIGDAHQYLLDHYSEFDFIWASPPCPSHSVVNNFLNAQGVIRYPDMGLYQEILFLKHFFKGKYCIENVVPYYEPLIKPQYSGRHCFWANFNIPKLKSESQIGSLKGKNRTEGKNLHKLGFDLSKYSHPDKQHLLNNCVTPEIGLAILNSAMNIIKEQSIKQGELF